MTCLLGNRPKAVLLLYQGGENYEKTKRKHPGSVQDQTDTPWKPWIIFSRLIIQMVWIKHLIVLIRGVGVGGFYKTTHRSNAEYANKQCWLQQEMRSLYFLYCEWEWVRDLQRPRERGPQHLLPFWILRDCWLTYGRPKSKGTVRRPKSTGLLTLITNNYMAGYLLR